MFDSDDDDGLSGYEYEDETSSYVSDEASCALTTEDCEIRSKIRDLALSNPNHAISLEYGRIPSIIHDPALDAKGHIHGSENELDAAIRNAKETPKRKKVRSRSVRKLQARQRRFVRIICNCYLDGHKNLLEDTAKRLGIDFVNGFLQEVARIDSRGQLTITAPKRKKLRINVRAVMDVIKTQYKEKYDNILAFGREIQKQRFDQNIETHHSTDQKRKVQTDVHNQPHSKRHKQYT